MEFLFWIAVACCVVAQAAIARSTLRAPARRAELRPGVPRPRRSIEVAWTVIPALALALVLVMTWRAIHQPGAADRAPIVLERAPSNT